MDDVCKSANTEVQEDKPKALCPCKRGWRDGRAGISLQDASPEDRNNQCYIRGHAAGAAARNQSPSRS